MATASQIEANRRNALLSTGPKTETGKRRSRWNSYRHGLAGSGVLMAADEMAELDRRMQTWRIKFGETNVDEPLLRELAVESIKLQRIQDLERAYRGNLIDQAETNWASLRRQEAEHLADELRAHPCRVGLELAQTLHGCEWMLSRWIALDSALDQQDDWTEPQRSLALDLLGVPPEFREGSTLLESDDPEISQAEHRKAVVERNIERLKVACQELVEFDDDERERYRLGLIWETDAVLDRLHRYESAARRMFRWAYDRLDRDARRQERRQKSESSPRSGLGFSNRTSRPNHSTHHDPTPIASADRSRDDEPLTDAERAWVEADMARIMTEYRSVFGGPPSTHPANLSEPIEEPELSPEPSFDLGFLPSNPRTARAAASSESDPGQARTPLQALLETTGTAAHTFPARNEPNLAHETARERRIPDLFSR